uniref:Ferric iron reductase n=1 Tax=Alloyangia mangrovi TaxID=1779329 RepID=A0A2A3JZ25_9RHOB
MCDGGPEDKWDDETHFEKESVHGEPLHGDRAQCISSHSDSDFLRCSDFFADAARLLEALEYQRSYSPSADDKACATFMLSDYVAATMEVLAPQFLHHRIVPSLAPTDVALSFQSENLPTDPLRRNMRVVFLSPDLATAGGQRDRRIAEDEETMPLADVLRSEIERHFAPLISHLSILSGLAPSAFWRLVADSVAAEFLSVGRKMGEEALAKGLALRIVKTAGSPLDNAQLHFFDLDLTAAGEPQKKISLRARGGCCRYYTVEGGKLCTTCVLKAPAERDRDLRISLRRRFGLDG